MCLGRLWQFNTKKRPAVVIELEAEESPQELCGWKYPFETLPGWDFRKENSWCRDIWIQDTSGKYACLIYSLAEIRMMLDVGYIAIFKRDTEVKLLLSIPQISPHYRKICFVGHELHLPVYLEDRMSRRRDKGTLIIDFKKNQFCYLSDGKKRKLGIPLRLRKKTWHPYENMGRRELWFQGK